jgi:sugar lactone lactonase YvrE
MYRALYQTKLLLVLITLPLAVIAEPYDDGIPPAWRQQHFGVNFASNPDALAVADPDGDGANNYQEYLGGTNPISASSVPTKPLMVSTFAGSTPGGQDGFRTEATFHSVGSLKFDPQGRMWACEAYLTGFQTVGVGGHRIRIMDADGFFTTFSGSDQPGLVDGPAADARYRGPNNVTFDSQGNVFVTDRLNHRIRKISPEGIVSTFAGSTAGFQDGSSTQAKFFTLIDIEIDAEDNLYVGDFDNARIRKITPAGVVSTFAGSVRSNQDGPLATATFDSPSALEFADDGSLFVADWAVGKIRKISPDGIVSTFATGLLYIDGLAIDSEGNVYGASNGNQFLAKYAPDGRLLWTLPWTSGFLDGPVGVAKFSGMGGPLFLADGSFLVIDSNHRIRQVTVGVPPLLQMNPGHNLFTNSLSVSMTKTASDAILRYTADGSEPSAASPVYVSAFTLTSATTVKARLFVNDVPVSDVITRYFQRVYALADGIPAAWREEYFGAGYLTDPRVAADADPDGDGATNLQEFATGSHPLDPLSGFRVSLRMSPTITWRSVPGEIYRVLRKESLAATDWTVVAPAVFTLGEEHTFVDTGATNNSGFYIVEPVPRTP